MLIQTAQGTKANNALQGVKVNGTLVTPDSNNMNSQSLALHECYRGIEQRPATANIGDSSSMIYLQNSSGECALQWRT